MVKSGKRNFPRQGSFLSAVILACDSRPRKALNPARLARICEIPQPFLVLKLFNLGEGVLRFYFVL